MMSTLSNTIMRILIYDHRLDQLPAVLNSYIRLKKINNFARRKLFFIIIIIYLTRAAWPITQHTHIRTH